MVWVSEGTYKHLSPLKLSLELTDQLQVPRTSKSDTAVKLLRSAVARVTKHKQGTERISQQ